MFGCPSSGIYVVYSKKYSKIKKGKVNSLTSFAKLANFDAFMPVFNNYLYKTGYIGQISAI